ncbi:general secretion pathway protein H [Rhodopseudomonas rhenobacensis]|uniref:General secretion pathway protein H n=1 Tax=Rhodopseudomonas rhenobacensis TaxID=87461 RepID=A0A7W7Z5U4_9BRAD|nr:type II secretion system protein [Rhodopseudomonas rhenobacensis]MBB5048563.1 general secretion pathway protein H [Rhodopseudomonas rhenobacensis]
MVKKVEAERQQTSSSASADERSQGGFALIEIVCVLAIIGMIAAVLLPSIPRTTSRTRLEAYAVEAASILKMDRNAARSRHVAVATIVAAPARLIRSGSSNRTIQLPRDVSLEAVTAANCPAPGNGPSIGFFPSGRSCGGTLALFTPGMRYEVRVNWLTGGIEIVPQRPV